VSLGGCGWAFRVYSLNSGEAALRPLHFVILKRAKRCRPKNKNKKMVTHTDKIKYGNSGYPLFKISGKNFGFGGDASVLQRVKSLSPRSS